ncbi:MAG: Membrane-bound lytic murein transglycosylase D precursor [Bacteroidetes bacterium ADurb.BinA245]|nr:MAG: Membrane-bound lytic murein transglycosylase D precursor [Bacteroidetes bacterium ADurb.BinA245]
MAIMSFAFLLMTYNAAAQINTTVADTTILETETVKDSLPLNDLKSGFKNLFQTAMLGDGINPGKLNPMAVSFVQDYIKKNEKGFKEMKKWAAPYFNMMDEVLSAHGIPKELKYLAVIESGLRYNAISWAGAVGPWAFMPAAARQYGLSISRHNDERLDYYKSTHAAARFLTDLYVRYGDWLLVVAAYNCGPGNVSKAIKKCGSTDFWKLQYYLPDESMNHVKKFIGTHYIFEGEGGVTTLTKEELKDAALTTNINLSKDELKESKVLKISGRYYAAVIAKHILMSEKEFNRYNPGFNSEIAISGSYELRLPESKMNLFNNNKTIILKESIDQLLATGS